MPTSLVYQHDGTPVLWKDAGSGGGAGGVELFTGAPAGVGLAAGAGRQGAMHDFGVAARPRRGVLRVWAKPGATRVAADRAEVYWKTGDGTHYDNNDGTGDIAVSNQNKLRNLLAVGVIQVDNAAAADEMVGSWDLEISARYGGPVIWNATANSLSNTSADYGISWTPVPDELQ